MTSRDKRFEQIVSGERTEYPYQWIKNFLKFHDFVVNQPKSSHFIFRNKSGFRIVMVVHQNRVKRGYVKDMVKKLIDEKIINF